MTTIDIFIAYSHKDLAFKDELRVQLRPLVRSGRAQVWDDYDIEAGREWDAVIKEKLFGAQIILLLVSPDSLDSDYFYGKEVMVSLERHARGEAVVVPVILRACLWQQTPLGALEALPTKGRPVASWPSRDDAWHAVAQEVSELIDTRRAELDRQSALEKQRREFAAATEAADLLFQRENWAEAAKAYADALGLNQPGFLPDATLLRERMTQCKLQVRTVADQQRREQADQQRRAEQVRKAQEAAERQMQKAERQRRTSPGAALNRLPLYGGLAVVGLLLLMMLVWQPWKSNGASGSVTDSAKNEAITIQQALDSAKVAGTIPAFREFIKRYPQSSQAAEARIVLAQKQKLFESARTNAALYIDEKDFKKAEQYLWKAVALDPQDNESINTLEQIKGLGENH